MSGIRIGSKVKIKQKRTFSDGYRQTIRCNWAYYCRQARMTVDKSKVSFCIVSYKSSSDIDRCLESIYKHVKSVVDVDIYVSNNQVPDKILDDVVGKYPLVKLINNPKNGGYGYANNRVIGNIKSEYHLILNPDIVFGEDSISELVEYLELNNDVVAVSPEIRSLDGSIQYLPKRYPKIRYVLSSTIPLFSRYRIDYTRANETLLEPTEIEVCTGSFMLVRTEVLKKIRGFDERFFMYFEDFDLSMRLRDYGRIIYYPKTFVYHLWRRDTKKSKKMFMISVISMIKFYLKHGTLGRLRL